ncbi:hypothetical protein KC19_10G045300 [Ceratodon purpureus]|uniref:Uncharacterized protein n=1 Tax=Ceratodon purpureus TaxID=3225 RepID=A0A8T0GI40_CERPU|nr:hypothetical protein KC19_10G045300 [Ceratodon purpureus]
MSLREFSVHLIAVLILLYRHQSNHPCIALHCTNHLITDTHSPSFVCLLALIA